jgi:hypothetical protein
VPTDVNSANTPIGRRDDKIAQINPVTAVEMYGVLNFG